MKDRSTLLTRIYALKLAIVALLFLGAGVALLTLARQMDGDPAWSWLNFWPLGEFGGILVGAGLFGIALDFLTGRDKTAADIEQSRNVQKELIPDYVDAVIGAFNFKSEDLKRVATPELLDSLATNALALRLGDVKFAGEIYQGLLAQAIRTPERWSDVDINVRLSSIDESSTGAARGHVAATLFDAVIVWEYTVVPSSRTKKFASTDDPEELRELLEDAPATSSWYLPDGTADPRERGSFEVLSYSVDGVELPLRRTERKHGQTFSVDLGEAAIIKQKPVRIRQVYRTVVPRVGHRFRISLTQPTHGMRLLLDHTDTDIAMLKVGEMVSSATPAQVKFLPEEAPARQVEVSVPGWTLPQAEVTFVWTLEDELPPRP